LVDHRLLSDRFRDEFLAGLTRLHRDGQLKLTDEWAHLQDLDAFRDWLQPMSDCDWVVFIEPPPTEDANPEHVLKYLARYLTGGPISDRRLIDHQDVKVTFWARGHDKKAGHQREPCTLRGAEFTRRWALHILPKGFVKSRCFGGFSCRHRRTYLDRCRALLGIANRPTDSPCTATTARPCPLLPRATANAQPAQGLLARRKTRFLRRSIGSLTTSSGSLCRVGAVALSHSRLLHWSREGWARIQSA
jgi:hypothetical protein